MWDDSSARCCLQLCVRDGDLRKTQVLTMARSLSPAGSPALVSVTKSVSELPASTVNDFGVTATYSTPSVCTSINMMHCSIPSSEHNHTVLHACIERGVFRWVHQTCEMSERMYGAPPLFVNTTATVSVSFAIAAENCTSGGVTVTDAGGPAKGNHACVQHTRDRPQACRRLRGGSFQTRRHVADTHQQRR